MKDVILEQKDMLKIQESIIDSLKTKLLIIESQLENMDFSKMMDRITACGRQFNTHQVHTVDVDDMQDRLKLVEEQLTSINTRHPPIPPDCRHSPLLPPQHESPSIQLNHDPSPTTSIPSSSSQ